MQSALEELGEGFLRHPANQELVRRLEDGELSTMDFFRELLRLVHRLLFLCAAEDRQLLIAPGALPGPAGVQRGVQPLAPSGSGHPTRSPRRTSPLIPYGIADILNDGCFQSEERLVGILQRLQDKKNLILQGPPGNGKTSRPLNTW